MEILFFIAAFIILTPVLGTYLARVFTEDSFSSVENFCYRICSIDPSQEMTWKEYGKALLLINGLGFITLFLILVFQGYLPLNPQNLKGVSWPLAFNITSSFVTNTNWQSYAGETTLSYFTQMVGLTSQNFLSAATGMGVLLALTRGLTRKTVNVIGNFWVDLVRMIVYILVPLSIILSLVLVGEGVIQTFSPYVEITTLENGKQVIPLGPAASQIAIKQLGTNGGGFFNANSAHPFENPTPLTNFLEMLAIIAIPAASVYAYGLMIGCKKHARLLFSAMFTLWIAGLAIAISSEYVHNPVIDVYPNLEGKETRFGLLDSLLWTINTAATSNGSVNAMISSLNPLSGGVALFNIMLGELIFGGVGVGLCSMLMFTMLTVFLAGLMVGRTPEYLGKRIEEKEIQWVVIAVLMPAVLILAGAGISSVLSEALSSLGNQGPHGLSEMLYAFASAAGNNGSAFAGLNANTTYYNLCLGLVMILGRVSIVLPSLALAGLMAQKKISPPTSGTFSTNSILFFVILLCVILIVGALTYFPALALGPIAEHFLMLKGRSF